MQEYRVISGESVERIKWACNVATDGSTVNTDVVGKMTEIMLENIKTGMRAPAFAQLGNKLIKGKSKTGKDKFSVPGNISTHYRHATYIHAAENHATLSAVLAEGLSKTDAMLSKFLRVVKPRMIEAGLIEASKSKPVLTDSERSIAWVRRLVKRLQVAMTEPVKTSADSENLPPFNAVAVARALLSGKTPEYKPSDPVEPEGIKGWDAIVYGGASEVPPVPVDAEPVRTARRSSKVA